MTRREVTHLLKSEALRLGFSAVGIAPAVSPPGYPDFLNWLEAGRAAGMEYMSRNQSARRTRAACSKASDR